MHRFILTVLISLCFVSAQATFPQDTSFIRYNAFSHLSKKEVKQQFGKDEASRTIIQNHYRHNRNPLNKLYAVIPLTAMGTYFAILAGSATNGMGSVVLLVLALIFLLPALAFLLTLVIELISGKSSKHKARLYEKLKHYFTGDN